jgi:hypothetical protein
MDDLLDRARTDGADNDTDPADRERSASERSADDLEGEIPLFGSWGRWYAIVLGNLAVLILLFYWFTKAYE